MIFVVVQLYVLQVIVILNVTLDASWWLIFHFTSSKMQLLLGDQRLWASSCWTLHWNEPQTAHVCVFKKYHNFTYIYIDNCFSSVFHREEEPSSWEMMTCILDHICLTSELPHISLRFNQKKQVGKLIMKTTSAGRFFKDTSRIPTVQRIHLLFHLEVGWPNWGSEYGEIPPVLANVWHLWRHVFCVYYWCIFLLVFEYIVCIRLCYWIFVTSKNYGHIFSYCNGWNWRWTNRSWLTFGHDLIICWITGRLAHLEDFYL